MPLDISDSQEFYNVPTSSPDPYASNRDTDTFQESTPPVGATLQRLSLPRGLPILGPLTGYTPEHLAKIIQRRNVYLSGIVGRPLSDQEFTAMAYYTSKGVAISSYGPTLGFTAAAYRIWATKDEFRWPFYGALKSEEVGKGVWDGEQLRIAGREVLKQFPAEIKARLLHTLRGASYLVLGMFMVPTVVSSYGATVSTVGELRDQRFAAISRAMRSQARQNMNGAKEKLEERRREREGLGKTMEHGRKDAGTVFPAQRGGGRVLNDDDDMSPTGGGIGFGDDDELGRLNTAADTGYTLGDREFQEKEARAQPDSSRSRSSSNPMGNNGRPLTSQASSPARQASSFEDSFDDASPAADAGSGSFATGSAWERIRQRSTSGSLESTDPQEQTERKSRRRREQQEDDGFMFSSEEQERSYARDEAQRQFDERVERERRGGDFGGGGGGGGGGDGGRGSGWRR